jgi:hypothetical protein
MKLTSFFINHRTLRVIPLVVTANLVLAVAQGAYSQSSTQSSTQAGIPPLSLSTTSSTTTTNAANELSNTLIAPSGKPFIELNKPRSAHRRARPSGPSSRQSSTNNASQEADLRGFWERNGAEGWVGGIKANSSKLITYANYPLIVDRIKQESAEDAKAREAANSKIPEISGAGEPNDGSNLPDSYEDDKPGAQQAGEVKPAYTPAVKLTREEILAKYGPPEEPQYIRAQKDAPPAMQGLFEALNSGDKELAFKYALALARRQGEMYKMVGKATDYQLIAMEALGIRPEEPKPDDNEPVDPIRAELQQYYEEARKAELKNGSVLGEDLGGLVGAEGVVGATGRGLGRGGVAGQGGVASGIAEAATAGAVRGVVSGSGIPIDPKGAVKVLIFIDEKSADASKMSNDLKALRERLKSDQRVSVYGLTKRTYLPGGLKQRGAEISFPFPLLSGEALAIDLRIKSYPTVVFVAASTKETYRIEGLPAGEEIERVVKVMQGLGGEAGGKAKPRRVGG